LLVVFACRVFCRFFQEKLFSFLVLTLLDWAQWQRFRRDFDDQASQETHNRFFL
jgi:hypothetical protein